MTIKKECALISASKKQTVDREIKLITTSQRAEGAEISAGNELDKWTLEGRANG